MNGSEQTRQIIAPILPPDYFFRVETDIAGDVWVRLRRKRTWLPPVKIRSAIISAAYVTPGRIKREMDKLKQLYFHGFDGDYPPRQVIG